MPPREVTLRAVVGGSAVGAVLAVGNLYLGMKTGFWEPGFVTAAILGFAVVATPGEHNVFQASASSTSCMPSTMGLLGAMPALGLLGAPPGLATLAVWGIVLALLGVIIAVALRPLLVDGTALPFPTARAAAEVIAAAAGTARAQTRALVGGGLVAAAAAWLRDGAPRWLPAMVSVTPTVQVALSPMLLATGALVGARTGLELVLGGTIRALLGRPDEWILWPAVGLLAGGGLTALALEWRSFASLGGVVRAVGRGRRALAAVVAAAAVVGVASVCLRVPPLVALLAVALAAPLIGVFLRVYAQTDIAHLGGLGQATQAGLALIAPGAATANVAGGSVAAGAGAQSVALLTSLRIGAMVGGRPGSLVAAQLIGIGVGTAVVVPAYLLLDRAYTVGSAALPVPFAQGFKAMGLLAEQGVAALPSGALVAGAVGLAVGVVLVLAGRARAGRWLPSPIIAGIAFLIPLPIAIAIAAGGVAARALGRRWPHLASAAAGAIAGESLVGVLVAVLIVLGVLAAP